MLGLSYFVLAALGAVAFLVIIVLSAISFRVVVTTNSVHIVQTSRRTTSYGRGQKDGNTYYRWPSWMPFLGVKVTVLPVSIFDRKLVDYAAYDIDRVPFVIDVVGFFRIADSNAAAERVQSFEELEEQLEPILQGAARTILATSTIDEILGSRAVFSEKFTQEVTKDLMSWGVEPVKSIELMDIRDANGSQVIQNIMAKKKSFIEMESRSAVAANMQKAKTAEIEASQIVTVRQQEAEQSVGQRTAQKEQVIGTAQADRDLAIAVSQQKAQQAMQEQAAITAEKAMVVEQVKQVRAAEIERQAKVVAADQLKEVVTRESEGKLAAIRNYAAGVQAEGEAKATAERLMQLAPVEAQITLAKEIGSNDGYQTYLVNIRQVEANQVVGVAQAAALEKADVKIVATAADAASGLDLIGLGTKIGAAVKAVVNQTTIKA